MEVIGILTNTLKRIWLGLTMAACAMEEGEMRELQCKAMQAKSARPYMGNKLEAKDLGWE